MFMKGLGKLFQFKIIMWEDCFMKRNENKFDRSAGVNGPHPEMRVTFIGLVKPHISIITSSQYTVILIYREKITDIQI